MFINRLYTLLLIVLFGSVVMLTVRESIATSAIVQQTQQAQHIQQGQDAESMRWLAMAKFYEKQAPLTNPQLSKPLTSYDAAEASAYRWQAIANYYLKHHGAVLGSQLPKPLTEYDAAEASAYRWQAIANYYLHPGSGGIR